MLKGGSTFKFRYNTALLLMGGEPGIFQKAVAYEPAEQ
jgi:hypothetical protein